MVAKQIQTQEDKKLEKIRDRLTQLFDHVGNISQRQMKCRLINNGFWKDIECHNGDWWDHWELEKQKTFTYTQPKHSGVVILAENKIKHYEETFALYEEAIRVFKSILIELPQFEDLEAPKREEMQEFENLFQESVPVKEPEVEELLELPSFDEEIEKEELEDFDESLLQGGTK